jgi:hypothetical protein
MNDFAKYRPMERKFGHKFLQIADIAHSEYGLKPIRPDIRTELEYLENKFSAHTLRYAGLQDIFINPFSVKHEKAFRYIMVVLRLANRYIRNSPYVRVA